MLFLDVCCIYIQIPWHSVERWNELQFHFPAELNANNFNLIVWQQKVSLPPILPPSPPPPQNSEAKVIVEEEIVKKPSRIGWKPLSVRAKSLALIVKGKLQGKSLRKPEKPFFFNYIDVIRLSFFMNCLRFSDIYADGNGKHRIDWLMQAIFFVRSVLEIRIGATEHRTAEANVIESWLLNTHFLCQRWKKFLHNTVGGQMGREMMAGASARKPPKPPKHFTTEYGQQIHGEDNGSEFQLYCNFTAKN